MSDPVQLINQAVAICVRRHLDTKRDVVDRTSLGREIGRRVQGTYGVELRALTEARPELSGQQLYEIVILASEFPWDAPTAKAAADQAFSGDRDRARTARCGPFLYEIPGTEITPPEEVPGRVAAIRQSLERSHEPERPMDAAGDPEPMEVTS